VIIVGKEKIVLFGGAIGDTNKYSITGDTYILDVPTFKWKKLVCGGVAPSPRAAHACAMVDTLQMVVYGGATGGGSLASDDLFLLDIRNGEDMAQWMIVPVVGTTPGRRYGHTLAYSKPNLLVFGGNNGTDTVNDVWILNVEKAPFTWVKLETTGDSPPARTYHSAALCSSGSATGMMVIFGGRGSDQSPLNDTWGLRKHRDGRWDWVAAPYKVNTEAPLKRYQHGGTFVGSLLFIIGGRTAHTAESVGLEIYDTETSEWHKFPVARRFRHACWANGMVIYIYGGFEYDAPTLPTDSLIKLDLVQLFAKNKYMLSKMGSTVEREDQFVPGKAPGSPMLPGAHATSAVRPMMPMPGVSPTDKKKPETPPATVGMTGQPMVQNLPPPPEIKVKTPDRQFKLAPTAVVAMPASAHNPNGKVLKTVLLESLQEESKKLSVQIKDPKLMKATGAPDSIYSVFINQLLRPRDWAMQQDPNGKFNFRKELIIALADQCIKIVQQQSIVIKVRAPIKVFGDVHGQYQDLMRFFDLWGTPSNDATGDIEAYDYLFLGDYVDRGSHSLETICLLMALKVKYPEQVHLLRGNHEDRWINNSFGFADECSMRLGEDHNDPGSVFNKVNELFDWLPLAAIIEDKIICLHGGIGSTLERISQIELLKRPLEVIHEVQNPIQQLVVDILWSDPTDSDQELGIQPNYIRDPNSTGNIVKYGPDKVDEFLAKNNLNMILRAHECVMDGFERFAGGTLITVFSATDYCGRHKNAGAVLFITRKFEIIPKLIYPLDTGDNNNWMADDEPGRDKRPPTPPRWNTAQFPRNNSFT